MNVQNQIDALNQIVQIMHDSAGGQYDEMCCEFDHETYDGGWSVGSKFSFVRAGIGTSELLDDPAEEIPKLVHYLHDLMKDHTGGDWKSFTLAIDASGKAHTSFVY